MPQSRLDHHDETVASLSVPVDHSSSVDVVVMRGRVADVAAYAEALFLERGVMHGRSGSSPWPTDTTTHVHAWRHHARAHASEGEEQFLTVDFAWSTARSKMPTTIGS